jgi:hypothetical protein
VNQRSRVASSPSAMPLCRASSPRFRAIARLCAVCAAVQAQIVGDLGAGSLIWHRCRAGHGSRIEAPLVRRLSRSR